MTKDDRIASFKYSVLQHARKHNETKYMIFIHLAFLPFKMNIYFVMWKPPWVCPGTFITFELRSMSFGRILYSSTGKPVVFCLSG